MKRRWRKWERKGEGRGWRRVYKLVIWGTGHVRGSRSLRRRNKSATYDPAFPFPSSPPTDFLPPPTSLSGSPSSSSSYSSYYSSTIPFLRARPRLFIRELPSLIISPSLFRSGVATMALTAEQIFQWFNGASRWKYRPYTAPCPLYLPEKTITAGYIDLRGQRSSFRFFVRDIAAVIFFVTTFVREKSSGEEGV